MMENYEKGEVHEVEEKVGIPGLDPAAINMRVKYGSKIRNLMGYAITKLKITDAGSHSRSLEVSYAEVSDLLQSLGETPCCDRFLPSRSLQLSTVTHGSLVSFCRLVEPPDPNVKMITWNGHGQAVLKTVTCAEITKRKYKGLHQISKIRYKRIEEYWEPKVEGLERLKVNRDIPAITILLSKEPLDESEPGYQPPGPFEAFLKKSLRGEAPQTNKSGKKKGGTSKGEGAKGSQPTPPTLARKQRKKGEKEQRNKREQDQGKKDSTNKQTAQLECSAKDNEKRMDTS